MAFAFHTHPPISNQPLVTLRAVVRGRVQSIGFRDFVITRARSLGLTGYVRNLPDGRSVEVVAEGPRPALARLVEKLRDGPRAAHVQEVETHWGTATRLHRDFGARYSPNLQPLPHQILLVPQRWVFQPP